MKMYMGEWGYSSTLDADEWSSSRLYPQENNPQYQLYKSQSGPEIGLDVMEIRKIHSISIYSTFLRSILISF
jgi:hypothetical protein